MQFKMQKHFGQNNVNAKITGKIQLKKKYMTSNYSKNLS